MTAQEITALICAVLIIVCLFLAFRAAIKVDSQVKKKNFEILEAKNELLKQILEELRRK